MSRKRRPRAALPTFGLSFLDLLSCAFGAVIILAVIVSASASQRIQLQSKVAVIDAELRFTAPPTDPNQSLTKFPLSLTIVGNWVGTWRENRAVTPVESEIAHLTVAALCVPDERCLSRHVTITGNGIEPGTYQIQLFHHERIPSEIATIPLTLRVAVYFDGREVFFDESPITLASLPNSFLWSRDVRLFSASNR